MKIIKIFDAVILIRLLQEIDGEEILKVWNNDPRYELWTTTEVKNEIKGKAKVKLNKLIEQKKMRVFDPVPFPILKRIIDEVNRLSVADSSCYYHCKRLEDSVCLSDDNPLRKHCVRNDLIIHGTMGIYLKMKRDKIFSDDYIEVLFESLLSDPRVFPNYERNQ
jgi:hypothetical protein